MNRIEHYLLSVLATTSIFAVLVLVPTLASACGDPESYGSAAYPDWSEVWMDGISQGWIQARLSPEAIRAHRRGGPESERLGSKLKTAEQWSSLNEHGDWKNTRRWGWVWTPSKKRRGWRPYMNGRWLATDSGWSFSGNEAFAEMVYHHGRWYRHRSYGWVWVPGSEKAPSWVVWRFGGGYVGWAPIGPSEDDLFPEDKAHDAWVFVRNQDFLAAQLGRVALPLAHNRDALDRSGFVGARNRRSAGQYHPGPKPSRLSRFAGRPYVKPLQVRRIEKPQLKLSSVRLIRELRSPRMTLRQPVNLHLTRGRLPADRILVKPLSTSTRIHKGKKVKVHKKIRAKKASKKQSLKGNKKRRVLKNRGFRVLSKQKNKVSKQKKRKGRKSR